MPLSRIVSGAISSELALLLPTTTFLDLVIEDGGR